MVEAGYPLKVKRYWLMVISYRVVGNAAIKNRNNVPVL